MFENIQLKVKPVWVFWVGVCLCAIRWGLIANGHDYGWDFETGYRVYRGGIYGKDFYTALGPLSYELIGFVFRLLGPHWVYIYLISYSCWVMTMLGIYQLLKNVSSNTVVLALALLIVTPLSIPHLVALHIYNFLGYALAVWMGVMFFVYLEINKYRYLFFGGVFAALALFTKQNIGLGGIIIIFVMLFLNSILNPNQTWRKSLVGAFVFGLGAALVSLTLFYFFAKHIEPRELWRLMFTDAAQAKGNALNMIKTAVPRFNFGTSNEHNLRWVLQHIAELFCLMLVVGTNLLLYRKLIFHKKSNNQINQSEPSFNDLCWGMALFVMILAVPLIFPKPTFLLREKIYWLNNTLKLDGLILSFICWVILVGSGCFFLVLFRNDRKFWETEYKKILVFIFSTGISFFICSSRFTYLFLNLSLFLGFFFVTTLSLGLWDRKKLFVVSVLLWVGAYFFYPTHALAPLVRLNDPQLSGLWFGKYDQESVELYTKELKPWVSGKRTLWLCMGGPHSLSGSIPVRNISNLYFDQYNSRIEESLVKEWMINPPEMIVRYWYALPGNSDWLQSELFENWIKKNYVQVTEIQGRKVLKYRF